jgi:hypothetical protein
MDNLGEKHEILTVKMTARPKRLDITERALYITHVVTDRKQKQEKE